MYLYLRKCSTISTQFAAVWPTIDMQNFRSLAHPQAGHRNSHLKTRFLIKIPDRVTYLPETLYIGLSQRVESSNVGCFHVVNTEVQFSAIISALEHEIRKNSVTVNARPSG